MRIGIIGAGGVGGYLAARLARAGREVAVVARGPHLAAIQEHGLTLESGEERFTVRLPAAADPAELGPCDLYIVTAKHPALPAIAKALAPVLREATPVAFAMNGVFWFYGHRFAPTGRPLPLGRLDPDGACAAAIGPERALGIIVYSPNEVTAPGTVHNDGSMNRFVIGDTAPAMTPRLREIATALDGCGFALETTTELRAAMWRKLMLNLSVSPLSTLIGGTRSALVADPAVGKVAETILREALGVAAAHGFADLGVDPARASAASDGLDPKPSMLQDLERGRPIEFDGMVAIVQDLARDAGAATPTLDVVAALLRLRARLAGCLPDVPAPAGSGRQDG